MSTLPSSPRLVKGAIVGIDPFNPLASIIIFQYNPKTMTRRLEAAAAQGGGAQSEALRLSGARFFAHPLQQDIRLWFFIYMTQDADLMCQYVIQKDDCHNRRNTMIFLLQ